MIKIKKDSIDDTTLHDQILKKIYDITKKTLPINIKSCGGRLLSLEIDDSKLSSGEKTKLKEYTDML